MKYYLKGKRKEAEVEERTRCRLLEMLLIDVD